MYIVHSDTIVLALVVIKILLFLHSLVMITIVSLHGNPSSSFSWKSTVHTADPLWDGEGCGPI